MWTYSLGPILSFLPSQWRNNNLAPLHIRWARAAMISALFELAIGGYFAWTSPSRIVTGFAAYFTVEGIVRFYEGVSTGEGVGSFPLLAIADLWRIAKRGMAPPKLPLVSDELLPGDSGSDLKIASCREKPDWRYPFTICYAGSYFQVTGHMRTPAGSRPFVYSLRRLPPGEVARGLLEYSPEDILTKLQPVAPVETD